MAKICQIEGCNNPVWSNGLCRNHTPKKPLKSKKKAINRVSERGKQKKEDKKKWLEKLHTWEFELWDRIEDKNGYVYCYETGTPMHRSIYRDNLCVYSHCFSKSKHPELAMESWNLLVVLPEIHAQWELDNSKTPKMLAYFNEIKEKYGL